MRFSVIIPIFNERESIEEFVLSLYHQTRKPDEILVGDGGSTDGTYEFLLEEQKKGKLRVFLYPSNIAQDRNFLIKKTQYDIVLCTDAGCKIDTHRCERIMRVYETTDEKVVGGRSGFIATSLFQKHSIHRLTSPDPNFHFISSRNMSFYKHIWEEVGGYPEELTLCGEDTYFNYKIQKAGYTIYYCKDAVVSRHMRKGYQEIYKMYRNYTQGDAEVWVLFKVIQSQSIKQAIALTGVVTSFLFLSFFAPVYTIGISIVCYFLLGLYTRTPGGYLFDQRFTTVKILGIFVGFWKGIFTGLKIKKITDCNTNLQSKYC